MTCSHISASMSATSITARPVEKTVDRMTREVGKRGYAFSQVRPRGDRDPANRTVSLVFVVEEGPRVYIERINVRGNTAHPRLRHPPRIRYRRRRRL